MSVSSLSGLVLIYGGGYLGQAVAHQAAARGMKVAITSRNRQTRSQFDAYGWTSVDPLDHAALSDAVAHATAVLITVPPDAHGCPAMRSLATLPTQEAWPDWIGYISSTSVYGDRAGGWAFEDDALNAATLDGARRVRAERDWLDTARGMGLTLQIFRLPGFYGPGRNVIERLRAGQAKLVRKPGQVFNRIHLDDVVSALFASMQQPRPGAVFNLTDDDPSPADEVTQWTAQLLGLPTPPEVEWTHPTVSDAMRRFYLDSKRISNARAKAQLGWRPAYPSYRDGLRALAGLA